jgi:hypothetical protein
MPSKTKAARAKRSTKTKRKRRPPAHGVQPVPRDARFVRDLSVRGEAAKPSADGTLPPDATHAITEDADGYVTLKRARFKLF